MADNTVLNPGAAGDTIASDDIAGIKHQRVKVSLGADGAATDALGGAGAVAAGVQRTTLASDDPAVASLAILDDWDETDRAKVNPIAGQAGVAAGAGAVSALTQRTTLASDDPAVASLGIIDDWDETDRAKVNIVVGQAGVTAGAGAVAVNTPRVTLASDDPAVASLSVLDDWDNAASDGISASGDVAHDAPDAGEPLKIGGRADTTFQTAVADGDRVAALFDVYGVQSVRGDHPNKWSYHENSSSALTDQQVQAAPGVGLSVYITDIILSLGAATALNLFLEETATTIIGPYYLEAVVGRSFHIRFATPKKCTANTALTVTTSAALAHGLDILGFIAP